MNLIRLKSSNYFKDVCFMKWTLLAFVALLIISLVGCGNTNEISVDKLDKGGALSSSQGSLHNYTKEALSKALSKHNDFPSLQPNKKKIEMVQLGNKKMKVSFSSDIHVKSIGGGVTKLRNGNKKWSGATDAIWFVTLRKIWHRKPNKADVESFWKYRYNPETDKIKTIESNNNDSQIKR